MFDSISQISITHTLELTLALFVAWYSGLVLVDNYVEQKTARGDLKLLLVDGKKKKYYTKFIIVQRIDSI